MMNLMQKYADAFSRYSKRKAFCAGTENYTYLEFLSLVNGSRRMLETDPRFRPQKPVGVLCNSLAETYAAIYAIWFSGAVFVPLSASSPATVNEKIIKKYQIELIFWAGENPGKYRFETAKILANRKAVSAESFPLHNWQEDQVVYVLNTSGSTGTPKNVPINLKNLTAFVEGFLERYPELNDTDNFLQTYELSADASFTGHVIPFLLGATVFSVPENTFRPFAVAKILKEQPVTWTKVTPSLLACLRPFFSSLDLPGIKHFHFGGEALPADMVETWRAHVPNAEISNGYGPTETTVTAILYKCLPGEKLKAKNNIVSIGLPLKNVEVIIRKTDHKNEYGELFIAGNQVMEGYWFADEQPFIKVHAKNRSTRFYPTGDQVWQDHEGNLFFMGRFDDQVKISGYRVDLVEIENAVRTMVPGMGNVAAAAVETSPGMRQLIVFIENYSGNGEEITGQMALHFPRYKIPERVIGVPQFPLNSSGKADKKMLITQFPASAKS
jgi:D-alanine--poly(phosphoribitol) ligase subunit 1